MYKGTVYEPFGTAAPSAYHPVAGEQERTDSQRGHVRKGFITPSDPGDQSSEFPLGEAVLPLMLCAVVFGIVIGSRRKKAEKKAKKFAYVKKKQYFCSRKSYRDAYKYTEIEDSSCGGDGGEFGLYRLDHDR